MAAWAARNAADQRSLRQRSSFQPNSLEVVGEVLQHRQTTLQVRGDENQAIAGLLHDAAEDQGGAATLAEIRAKFGDAVADIVADCTDAWTEPKPPWRARKKAYLDVLLHKSQTSLLVALADKTHNAEAILFDYRALGPALWDRFNGGADGTRWYYGELSSFFARTIPGGLSDRLSRAVQGFSD
jgi:(p)ppGpp synthase/HD superfamily hydrolase